ncbi:MAG: protein-L-isoaspartate O-methyltransferase [Magnetovibrio sp.]|nr:protein-L-isoaspartate O-methyltransferase [Magnetovibrio sp.]
MGNVPRERFVSKELIDKAYDNTPLPIGLGQTISQPYIVGFMTDILNIFSGARVLEVGTGSGYQAAVLATLNAKVYTVEILPDLSKRAKKCFSDLGLKGIRMCVGNGYFGWKEKAPFERIIVTAAAPRIPPSLVSQLKPGGRMVIPIGQPDGPQNLIVIDKNIDGKLVERSVLPVRFVPLTGGRQDKAQLELIK